MTKHKITRRGLLRGAVAAPVAAAVAPAVAATAPATKPASVAFYSGGEIIAASDHVLAVNESGNGLEFVPARAPRT